MITTLILLVCLHGAGVCKEESPAVPAGMSCLINAQEIASDWLAEHPKWELKGWRCRFGVPERKA